jgi:seryl-tRNA synthetase
MSPLLNSMNPTVSDDQAVFKAALIEHGFMLPSGVRGIGGFGAKFEDILQRFNALVSRIAAADHAEELTFPPVVARALIEKVGYLGNFPHLIGSVHSFFGSELQAREMLAKSQAGERWEDALDVTDVMLTPAACYPVYPLFSGKLSPEGRLVTTLNWVFRHEPSDEVTRFQSFRMREFIRVGDEELVVSWRDQWLERARNLLLGLGLPVESEIANDPFFGRAGKMLATNQREQRLKFELKVPVISAAQPTAVCSFNWHQEHFSSKFNIHDASGHLAQTACLGFGLERVTLALLKTHGLDTAVWPQPVREMLWN